jgi:hypothetical protein
MKDFNSKLKSIESDGGEANKCYYPVRLDTYGCGCAHDCSYCYSKSMLDFRKLWNPQNPSVGDISEISKEIRKLKRGGADHRHKTGRNDRLFPAD